MNSSRRLRSATTANIDNMVERLGIDLGCCVVPRFNLIFSCALRNCGSCTARKACTEWLEKDQDDRLPPKFCLNFDLLLALLYEPAAGHRAHSVH